MAWSAKARAAAALARKRKGRTVAGRKRRLRAFETKASNPIVSTKYVTKGKGKFVAQRAVTVKEAMVGKRTKRKGNKRSRVRTV